MRIFFAWLNKRTLFTPFTIEFCLYKKARLNLLLLVFFFFGLSLSSVSDSEEGFFMVSLLFDTLSSALSLVSLLLIILTLFSLLVDTVS